MIPLALGDTDLQFTDLCFHPSTNLIGSAVITGDVLAHKYRPDGHTEAWRQEDHHKGGVRCVEFSDNGTELYSAGSDGTLQAVDSETGSCVWAVENAHSDAINAMVSSRACHVVTGDDEGKIKQWDLRSPPRISVVNEWKEQSDYISDLHVALDGRSLLSTSGDTTLAVFDLRSNKKVRLSDPQEDELLCVKVMKAGRKVVCGSQNGVLLIWSWGVWGDCSDRFPGFPPDISALEVVDEDTVVIGGCDGHLYVASLQPNAIIGNLSDDVNDSLLPVERLAFSGDREWLGWVSHDEKIRFLDTASLKLGDNSDDNDNDGSSSEECSSGGEEEEEESLVEDDSSCESLHVEQDEGEPNTASTAKRQRRIESDDDDDDDSDDDDRDSDSPYSSSVKRQNSSKKQMSKTEQFFSDL